MLKIASLTCTHQDNWSPEDRIIVIKYDQIIPPIYSLLLETEYTFLSFRISQEDIKQIFRLVYKEVGQDRSIRISQDKLKVYLTNYGNPYLKVLRVDYEDISIDVNLSQVLQIFANRKRRKP